MGRKSGGKRIAVRLIGALLLAVLLFSAFFIAVEAGHDCSHEDCPICACIRCCEAVLQRFLRTSLVAAIAPVVLSALILSAARRVYNRIPETPVSAKIRLND